MSIWNTPLGIAGIVMLVLGIILTIVGIILLVINKDVSQPWWVWVILTLGILMSIIGGILLAVAYSRTPKVYMQTSAYVTLPEQHVSQSCVPEYVAPKQQVVTHYVQHEAFAPQVQPQPVHYVQQSNCPLQVKYPQALPQDPKNPYVVKSSVSKIDNSTFDADPFDLVTVYHPPPEKKTMKLFDANGNVVMVSGTFRDDTVVKRDTVDYPIMPADRIPTSPGLKAF